MPPSLLVGLYSAFALVFWKVFAVALIPGSAAICRFACPVFGRLYYELFAVLGRISPSLLHATSLGLLPTFSNVSENSEEDQMLVPPHMKIVKV